MGKKLVSIFVAVCAFALVGALAGCSLNASSAEDGSAPAMRIGTMQTEDALPFWIAQQEGLYDAEGVSVDIVTFQSAQELSAAFASGDIDAAMTDVQTAATLKASGTDVSLAWVTLGADASQGRFGIMTSPESGITSLADLAGTPIGVGSNTVPEYVMDRLMEKAGVPDDQIVKEEIKKLPVRFESMTNNQVAAAALPGSLLALGESSGMVLLADDSQGDNISQSVLAVRADWASSEGADALSKASAAWDAAVDRVNADPESYRSLLVESANLPAPVAETYRISTYPKASTPAAAMVQPVLDWMLEKGYLSSAMAYDESTGAFS